MHQIIHQNIEDIELQSTSNRVTEAIRHAFVQRDAEFLASGGVLPDSEPDARGNLGSPINDEFIMSGGLAADDEG